jgi:hypothetical protein
VNEEEEGEEEEEMKVVMLVTPPTGDLVSRSRATRYLLTFNKTQSHVLGKNVKDANVYFEGLLLDESPNVCI